ncbi:MAG: hypothetical protein ACD_19C00425G0004 [uncultured bacterium]|nr:MAG: hypothetical protein ACD_19C00425G0004 [uncultured bacterium]
MIAREIVSLDQFKVKINEAKSTTEVLARYLLLNEKDFIIADNQELVALRLLDFGETDMAMDFIKMAESRRLLDLERKSNDKK